MIGLGIVAKVKLNQSQVCAWCAIATLITRNFVRSILLGLLVCLHTKEFKKGNPVSFWPMCYVMGRRPYYPSRMEENYCTFGSGAIIMIIRHDQRTLLHIIGVRWRVFYRTITYSCVIQIHAGKAIRTERNRLAGLATKKSRDTITHLHI